MIRLSNAINILHFLTFCAVEHLYIAKISFGVSVTHEMLNFRSEMLVLVF